MTDSWKAVSAAAASPLVIRKMTIRPTALTLAALSMLVELTYGPAIAQQNASAPSIDELERQLQDRVKKSQGPLKILQDGTFVSQTEEDGGTATQACRWHGSISRRLSFSPVDGGTAEGRLIVKVTYQLTSTQSNSGCRRSYGYTEESAVKVSETNSSAKNAFESVNVSSTCDSGACTDIVGKGDAAIGKRLRADLELLEGGKRLLVTYLDGTQRVYTRQ